MRNRSVSIYAHDKDEFKQVYLYLTKIMKQTSVSNNKPKRKSKFSKENSEDKIREENYQNFSSESIYIMKIRETTLEEQEKIEEDELQKHVRNLNNFYKGNDKEEFINTLTNLNKGLINSLISIDNDDHLSIKRNFSSNSFENLHLFNNSFLNLSNLSTNDSNFQSLIHQNLELFEDVIKIMVIGDNHTGKSFLISQLLSHNKHQYMPTKNLEIQSKLHKIFGKYIKIEFFDTFTKVLKDPIISIYYKLSQGFILICDNQNINSVFFLEDQIEKIMNLMSDKSIMLICNEKKKVRDMNKNEIEKYITCMNYMDKIENEYQIKFRHINIYEASLNSSLFEKFLRCILIKKDTSFKQKNNNSREIKYSSLKRQINRKQTSTLFYSNSQSPLRIKDEVKHSKCLLI